MREQQIDLWEAGKDADAVAVTTNGTITKQGRGVMGRGCALEAVSRYALPADGSTGINLPLKLGRYLHAYGNNVGVLMPPPPYTLVAFPVKHEYNEDADLVLIQRSLLQLVELTTKLGWTHVVLPRPGCGNGNLAWDDVKVLCLETLDDRFLVVWK